MPDKASLRKIYAAKREAISRSAYWALNDLLLHEAKKMDWSAFKTLHVYLPIAEAKEPDTFMLLDFFKKEYPHLAIAIPRTDFKNLKIGSVLYDHEYTILGRNRYNIPEPIHGKPVEAHTLDAAIVPLLAYDEQGYRVGYGKGFYDRFLAQCRPDIRKIGLSFFDPEDKIEDINRHDIALDCCITPAKLLEF